MRNAAFKKLIAASIVSLAGSAGLLFIFITASDNVQNHRKALATTVTKLTSGEKDFDRLNRISDLLKNRQSDIKRLQGIAVERARPLAFIETIEQIGHLTKVKVSLGVDEIKGSGDSLFFGATLEGTEKSVRTMLALINALPYQIAIESITFQRDIPGGVSNAGSFFQPVTRIVLAMRVKTQQ